MTRLIDDPRLTAYALGELSDSERRDIEALLRDSAEAREWVEQVRETGDELRHALQSAAATGDLPAACDASVADRSGGSMNFAAPALGGTLAGASLRHWLHIVRLPLAVAASLTLTVLVAYPLMTPQLSRSRGIASRERVALAQREQERSEYKEVSDEISADRKQYAQAGKDTASRLISDLEMSRLPWTETEFRGVVIPPPPPAKPDVVAGQLVTVERDRTNDRSAATPEAYLLYGRTSRDGTPAITDPGQRAVVAGTPLALIDPVTSAYLLRREDGSPDTRPFSRLGFTRGAPESPDGGIGDPFSGGNWLIGGNPESGMPMQLAWPGPQSLANEPPSAEAYAPVVENPFLLVEHQPLSTFSIDVDTASYTNVRRFLNEGQLPPPGAVRIEEMINYFTYNYPQPTDGHPFATTIEVAECPWEPNHRLARIGVQGEVVAPRERPAANLVFLVDVSGSMSSPNKLPLVKASLLMLLDELAPRDRVAVVTYAGTAGVALPSTPLASRDAIFHVVDGLQSGGSTNGASGITMAYEQAEANFVEGGINRVIIATDGDFNVGVTSRGDLLKLIEDKAKSGVFLSVLGYGMGNLKDATLELLADKGNGHYAYIDSIDEAEHVLVEQMMGTLMTIAKDVKIQVEFNPAKVGAYRLVGYENRMLQAKDFNDDTKDAGEIGSGHSVTALYEIVPAGMTPSTPGVDPLKYQKPRSNSKAVVATQDAEGEPIAAGETRPTWFDGEGSDAAGDTGAGGSAAAGDAGEVDEGATRQVGEPCAAGGTRPTRAAGEGSDAAVLNELLTVKLRYKRPDGDVSTLIEVPVTDDGLTLDESSDDFAFAAAVASFGMLLRDSAHAERLTFDAVVELASTALGADESGERAEFTSLVTKARDLRAANQPQ